MFLTKTKREYGVGEFCSPPGPRRGGPKKLPSHKSLSFSHVVENRQINRFPIQFAALGRRLLESCRPFFANAKLSYWKNSMAENLLREQESVVNNSISWLRGDECIVNYKVLLTCKLADRCCLYMSLCPALLHLDESYWKTKNREARKKTNAVVR